MSLELIVPVLGIMTGIIVPIAVFVWLYFESKDTPAGGFVSAEDFAVALIDEAVAPKHMRERFTVASQDEEAAQG